MPSCVFRVLEWDLGKKHKEGRNHLIIWCNTWFKSGNKILEHSIGDVRETNWSGEVINRWVFWNSTIFANRQPGRVDERRHNWEHRGLQHFRDIGDLTAILGPGVVRTVSWATT